MDLNKKINLLCGIFLTILHLISSQKSLYCDELEKNLNLNDEEKLRLNLNRK